ncbi:MAG: hypothetical protein ACSLFQ_20535 [Thermoanaerobaculia bacterium]
MDKAERLSVTLVLAAATALAVAALILVAEHGVDVFLSDQWMINAPFFEGDGPLGAFLLQHGPHRIGGGSLVTWAGLSASGWDARADSVAVIAICLLSCLAALALKRKLFGRIDGLDLVIPAIVLNLVQVEAVVLVPIPAHGVLPTLFLLLACLAFASPSGWSRAIALSLLAPLLLFTGFGMVAAPILLALFAHDASLALRRDGPRASAPHLLPVVALACALPLFLAGYRVEPGTPASLVESFRFAALMPARFGSIELGRFGGLAVFAGAVLLAAMTGMALQRLARVLRAPEDTRSRAIFTLSAFTLLFVALAAAGRAAQGAQYGQSSRYMPLMVPGMLALYFAARSVERKGVRVALTAFVVALSAGAVLPVSLQHDRSTVAFSEARRDWRDCYLVTRDAQQCAERARMPVWVGPYGDEFQAQLDFLERNRLSLFRARD